MDLARLWPPTPPDQALFAQLLLVAELLGLPEPLLKNIRRSPMTTYQRMESWIPEAPTNARRWVSEMQEIEATFRHRG